MTIQIRDFNHHFFGTAVLKSVAGEPYRGKKGFKDLLKNMSTKAF